VLMSAIIGLRGERNVRPRMRDPIPPSWARPDASLFNVVPETRGRTCLDAVFELYWKSRDEKLARWLRNVAR
jgi:hypothetical protein